MTIIFVFKIQPFRENATNVLKAQCYLFASYFLGALKFAT